MAKVMSALARARAAANIDTNVGIGRGAAPGARGRGARGRGGTSCGRTLKPYAVKAKHCMGADAPWVALSGSGEVLAASGPVNRPVSFISPGLAKEIILMEDELVRRGLEGQHFVAKPYEHQGFVNRQDGGLQHLASQNQALAKSLTHGSLKSDPHGDIHFVPDNQGHRSPNYSEYWEATRSCLSPGDGKTPRAMPGLTLFVHPSGHSNLRAETVKLGCKFCSLITIIHKPDDLVFTLSEEAEGIWCYRPLDLELVEDM
ncbi:hypothetical protein B0H10DRAFT_2290280 [Mycena sp. CBHHK59/15]|nr:hypothetical protein B0H10DRAFT_2290280 [Mycena sp. CBHHK59/15]